MKMENLYIPLSKERIDKVIDLAMRVMKDRGFKRAVWYALDTLGHGHTDAFKQVGKEMRLRAAAKRKKIAKNAENPPREVQGRLF
jgi:hypothetical protein